MKTHPQAKQPDKVKQHSQSVKKATVPKRSATRGVRIEDVAKLAGVAPMTVSRALNHPHMVSEQVAKKIEIAIQETGYVPNRIAGSLASNKSRLIAVIQPSLNSVTSSVVQGMYSILEPEGYQLVIGLNDYSNEPEEKLVRAFLGQRVDGLLLTGTDHSPAVKAMLKGRDTPVVETLDMSENPLDMVVGFAPAEVGAAIARYFSKKKYKKVGVVIAPASDDRRADRRADGFVATCRALGLSCLGASVRRAESLSSRGGAKAFLEIMSAHDDIDAVFFTNDKLALGAIFESVRQEWRLPEKVAIAGVGDLEFAADVVPSLTTVRIPAFEAGRQSAQMLLNVMNGEKVAERMVELPIEVIERDSA